MSLLTREEFELMANDYNLLKQVEIELQQVDNTQSKGSAIYEIKREALKTGLLLKRKELASRLDPIVRIYA